MSTFITFVSDHSDVIKTIVIVLGLIGGLIGGFYAWRLTRKRIHNEELKTREHEKRREQEESRVRIPTDKEVDTYSKYRTDLILSLPKKPTDLYYRRYGSVVILMLITCVIVASFMAIPDILSHLLETIAGVFRK